MSRRVAPLERGGSARVAEGAPVRVPRHALAARALGARRAGRRRDRSRVSRTLHGGECIVSTPMALDPLRLCQHVHGHLGWLAAALLAHPALVLRNEKRRAHLAVLLATGAVTLGAGLGAWLYVGYRDRLKQQIFIHAPSIGLIFERKEHLAFASVVLAWAGCAAYFGAIRSTPAVRSTLRKIAFRAFAFSAALAIVVSALGTAVAVYKSF